MNWICKNCETKNEAHQSCCYVCGAIRDEVKAVTFDEQNCTDKNTRSQESQFEDVKKPWLRSTIAITLLTLMMFGLLIVGIKLVARSTDSAASGSLETLCGMQEQLDSEQGAIIWHDAFLEDGIHKALGKGEGENITFADTAGIYALSIVGDTFVINDVEFGAKVVLAYDGAYLPDSETAVEMPERTVSLEDLAQFPNLTSLTFVASDFSSIEGLESCDRLIELILDGKGIDDISPISSLQNLKRLHLGGALDDSDLQTIGLLTKLEYLSIPDCSKVISIAPLANLKNLEVLKSYTEVMDIQAIASMTKLKELYLEGVQATNYSALSGLTKLEKLSLPNTNIFDLSPLSNLTKLQVLDLYCCSNITDILALSGMTELQDLNLDGVPITEIKALSTLKKLEQLDLTGTKVEKLVPLKDLTNLKTLILFYNFDLRDLSPLKSLTSLKTLNFADTNVTDLSPLKNLTNLEQLVFFGTTVEDLAPLMDLKSLEMLDCNSTNIGDLTPLKELINLKTLIICFTNVQDLTPLKELSLEYIEADESLQQELREMFPSAEIN